jgi:hypothetical protein
VGSQGARRPPRLPHTIQNGSTTCARVATELRRFPLVSVCVVVERTVAGANLRRLTIVGGPSAAVPERTWGYSNIQLISGGATGSSVVRWFARGRKFARLRGHRFPVPSFQDSVQWRREPSRSTWGIGQPLPEPHTRFDVRWATPGLSQWGQLGILVGGDAPSFLDADTAISEFFGVTGRRGSWNVPSPDEAVVQLAQTGAWLADVLISPASLTVSVSGERVLGCRLELNSTSRKESRNLATPGGVAFALPDGLEPNSWLVLSRDGLWLDHRRLDLRGGDGVEVEPPPLADRLAVLVSQGEGPTLEVKRQLPATPAERKKLAATVAAFCNGGGGWIIYGIENETLRPGGVSPTHEDLDGLHRTIRDLVDPPPVVEIAVADIGDHSVVAIAVLAGSVRPYGINRDALDVYVRRGANTVRARSAELRGMSSEGSGAAPIHSP